MTNKLKDICRCWEKCIQLRFTLWENMYFLNQHKKTWKLKNHVARFFSHFVGYFCQIWKLLSKLRNVTKIMLRTSERYQLCGVDNKKWQTYLLRFMGKMMDSPIPEISVENKQLPRTFWVCKTSWGSPAWQSVPQVNPITIAKLCRWSSQRFRQRRGAHR